MNPDEPLRTKNLAEEEPAAMDDTLGGYAWLPRMVDKARASHAGTLGQYFRYPCPIDTEALSRLGVTAEAFARLSGQAATGRAILEGLVVLQARTPQEAAFDPVKLNEELHRDDPIGS